MSFVITNTGLTSAIAAAGGGSNITLATFKLGTAFNYTPLATQTDISGTPLYSGNITSVQPYDANTVDVLIQIPSNAGPFSFGEVAIFTSSGSMFACHAYPQLQYKSAGLSSGVGSVWGIHCLLRLVQANTVFNIVSGTAPLDSPTFTGAPTVPTPALDNSSTRISNTVWYHNQRGVAVPMVNSGSGSAGSSARWSSVDHVHPIDTSRAPLLSPFFTGEPRVPTPSVEDLSSRVANMAVLHAFSGNQWGASSRSFTTAGYQHLPSGLILQWDKFAIGDNSPQTRSFALAFPNACFSVTMGKDGINGGATRSNWACYATSNSQYVVSAAGVGQMSIFAIGY